MTSEPSVRLVAGDSAPELRLTNADGELVRLADLHGRPVVVYFFPKAFTPGCTTEVCDFRDHKATLERAGYLLLGISGDSPEQLAEFRDSHHVNHDLLSDQDHETARRWGAFGPKVIGGQPTTGPLRSTFILDDAGVVQSAEYELDPDGHVSALLAQVGV